MGLGVKCDRLLTDPLFPDLELIVQQVFKKAGLDR
jgi:hypothetical protein